LHKTRVLFQYLTENAANIDGYGFFAEHKLAVNINIIRTLQNVALCNASNIWKCHDEGMQGVVNTGGIQAGRRLGIRSEGATTLRQKNVSDIQVFVPNSGTSGTTIHKVVLDPTLHHAIKLVPSDRLVDDYQVLIEPKLFFLFIPTPRRYDPLTKTSTWSTQDVSPTPQYTNTQSYPDVKVKPLLVPPSSTSTLYQENTTSWGKQVKQVSSTSCCALEQYKMPSGTLIR
jgi:hypothetical protein